MRILSLRRHLLIGCLLLGACAMGDLLRFAAAVTREFGPSSINITNRHLQVTLQRSAPSAPDREATARRVAEFVRDRYPGYAGIDEVSVEFQNHQQYGPVGLTRGEGSYRFTHAQLGEPRPR